MCSATRVMNGGPRSFYKHGRVAGFRKPNFRIADQLDTIAQRSNHFYDMPVIQTSTDQLIQSALILFGDGIPGKRRIIRPES